MCNRGTPGPGPAKYLLPSLIGYPDHAPNKHRNPQYSMRARTAVVTKPTGGGIYNVDNVTRNGKTTTPAYSIRSRRPERAGFTGPGPDRYNVDPKVVGPRPPAYSIRGKPKGRDRDDGPGPKYNVPSSLGQKAYSISSRRPQVQKDQSPGPAAYGPVNADKYRHSHPKYTISGRSEGVKGKGASPGPAAYGPYEPKTPGGFSFGHKTCTTPYITAEDELPCIEH